MDWGNKIVLVHRSTCLPRQVSGPGTDLTITVLVFMKTIGIGDEREGGKRQKMRTQSTKIEQYKPNTGYNSSSAEQTPQRAVVRPPRSTGLITVCF